MLRVPLFLRIRFKSPGSRRLLAAFALLAAGAYFGFASHSDRSPETISPQLADAVLSAAKVDPDRLSALTQHPPGVLAGQEEVSTLLNFIVPEELIAPGAAQTDPGALAEADQPPDSPSPPQSPVESSSPAAPAVAQQAAPEAASTPAAPSPPHQAEVAPPPPAPTAPPPPPPTQRPAPTSPPATATARPAPTIAPPAPAAAGLAPLEQQLFDGQNGERARAGVAALRIDSGLEAVARRRANDMASKNYFSHVSPTGETAFSLIDAAGITARYAGENIGYNTYPDSQSAASLLAAFMASPGHRANILNAVYTRVGVAVAFSANGTKYFAVVFGGP